MSVSCECCVLSGIGLCDELIFRPGVLPSVVCLSVIMNRRQRGSLGPPEPLSHGKKKRIVARETVSSPITSC